MALLEEEKAAYLPLHNNIVVRPDERESMSRGGVYIPDNAQHRQQKGTVEAIGPGRLLDDGSRGPMTVKVGDHIIYSKYGGSDVQIDGEELVVISEDQVYAVLGRK